MFLRFLEGGESDENELLDDDDDLDDELDVKPNGDLRLALRGDSLESTESADERHEGELDDLPDEMQ